MKNKKTNVGSFLTTKLQAERLRLLAIALVAVTGFSFTACGGGAGGGLPPPPSQQTSLAYRFTGTPVNELSPPSSSIRANRYLAARSVTNSSSEVSAALETFYGALGAKKASYTPEALELAIIYLGLTGTYEGHGAMQGIITQGYDDDGNAINPVYDLVNPITVNAGYVYPGNYDTVDFNFAFTGFGAGENTFFSKVRFKVPGYDFTANSWYNQMVTDSSDVTMSGTDTMEFLSLNWLMPRGLYARINYENPTLLDSSLQFVLPHAISGIFMTGNSSQLFKADGEITKSDVSSSLPAFPGLHEDEFYVITPFSGVNTANAKSVTFYIAWDMENLIERYEGETASPNDDIFVFKKGFWNNFSVYVDVEDWPEGEGPTGGEEFIEG